MQMQRIFVITSIVCLMLSMPSPSYVHTIPDIFETVYIFYTNRPSLHTKPYCFETALQSGLRPFPHESG